MLASWTDNAKSIRSRSSLVANNDRQKDELHSDPKPNKFSGLNLLKSSASCLLRKNAGNIAFIRDIIRSMVSSESPYWSKRSARNRTGFIAVRIFSNGGL